MTRARLIGGLLVACLLLALSGCGNKGPLVLPEKDKEEAQKTQDVTE